MRIDRRSFVGAAGLAIPVTAATAAATYFVDVKDDRAVDATPAINEALVENSDVSIPSGQFRIDGTIVVGKHRRLTLSHGTVLRRFADKSDNTDAVVAVVGNRAYCSGGRIVTENSHPHGVIKLGHEGDSTDIRYNATHWYFGDCSIEGLQEKGNVSIWIPNAQVAHKSTRFANYFGHVQNVAIRGGDTGVLLDEVSNAHRFYGVFMSHLISSAWELRGAYANQVFGGFLHQSANGIIAIRLRNAVNDRYHDSIYNSFFGFGIEPGGADSAAYDIESNCRRNTLFIQSNVLGKSVDRNGENLISRHGGDWPNANSIL